MGFVCKWPSKMQGQGFFLSRVGGSHVWAGTENCRGSFRAGTENLRGAAPDRICPPPEKFVGGVFNVLHSVLPRDCGGFEWQCTLQDLEKIPYIVYNAVLLNLIRIGVSNASFLLVAI